MPRRRRVAAPTCPTRPLPSADAADLRARARLSAGVPVVLGRRRRVRAGDGAPPARLRRGSCRRTQPARGPRPAGRRPRRVCGGPGQDVPRPARRAHARRDLLGLRPAHRRDREHRDRRARSGDRLVAPRRCALDGRHGPPERRGRGRHRGRRVGVRAALHQPPGAPDLQPRRAADPGHDRRARGGRAARRGVRGRGRRGQGWGDRVECPGRPAARPGACGARCGICDPVVDPHRTRLRVPRVPALQQAPPHRDGVPERVLPEARAARRAAGHGPRARGRHVRPANAPGPRLEGPPRRLHVHRVRALPGGLPGLEHGQAAQPEDVHHGHPGDVGRGRARAQPDPERPPRARDVRPRRRDLGDGARNADRGRRDPVRRGLGLRHLRRVRRGLPGPDRARRQDRRAAPQPGPRGIALSARARDRVSEHGGAAQPVGPAAHQPRRLDPGLAVRGPDRRRPGRRGDARRPRGPVLGRLRGRVR